MSWTPDRRTRNAEEFLERYRTIRRKYESGPVPRLADLRRIYAGGAHVGEAALLEAHVRRHLVDKVLRALNWPISLDADVERPDLAVEVPVRSRMRGTVRFLDYFGLDRGTGRPLLVAETKRPDDPWPELAVGGRTIEGAEAIARGLSGEQVRGGWNEWLETLRDYVRSVKDQTGDVPQRVVITNGTWMAVFLNPTAAFLNDAAVDQEEIFFCKTRDELEIHATQVFLHLEHQSVLGACGELPPGGLGFIVATADVHKVMHAVRVRYSTSQGVYRSRPVITVAPIILLQARTGTWLRVSAQSESEILVDPDTHADHRASVADQAQSLLLRVNAALGAHFQPSPLTAISGSALSAGDLMDNAHPTFSELKADDYYVVTGEQPHFLLSGADSRTCEFHDWQRSQRAGVASTSAPIDFPSVEERSFFTTGGEHHCSHVDVHAAKRTALSPESLRHTGPRGGYVGEAFCILWSLERHLCCRTCVFQSICLAATGFRLPCLGAAEPETDSTSAAGPQLVPLSYKPRSGGADHSGQGAAGQRWREGMRTEGDQDLHR